MRIVVARDATSAARAAAEFIGDRLTRALARERGATLALSGGRAATALFEALAEQPLPWQAIDVFQVDERIVPSDHLARNLGLLMRSPLARHLAADRIHPIPIELGDPARVARRYAETLAAIAGDPPALDVVHLGLGPDGHTASLFRADPEALASSELVGASGRHAGHARLTLTLAALNGARSIAWLVTGAEKAAALAGLERRDRALPGAWVERKRATCFADEAAAAALARTADGQPALQRTR
ncbi:MAG TPA: 6-phosphogluconolactonase [Burkholderiales bacterium]|nr:6-phosphogluconolactonase [Burkholderiales bacterium]